MAERSVTRTTFVVERTYDASPARVFAAWADPAAKARWFAGPDDWEASGYELDFRAGGNERASGGPPGSPVHTYNARYYDIVANERIISSYEMHMGQIRISVSLATVEFKQEGTGTRLTYTDQGAFLDGYDNAAQREQGTVELLDALAEELQRTPASA